MEATRDTTPVVLSGSAVTAITAGVRGPSGSFPSAGMVNLLSGPMEFSDLIVTTTVRGVGLLTGAMPPTNIVLDAGRHGLTNGPVPVISLGLALDPEPSPFPLLADGVTNLQTFTTRWIFPRPLILRPGESISGGIETSPLGIYIGITATITTTITARGRRIPASSVGRILPYPFSSGAFYQNTILNRNQPDLVHRNVFPVPLNVVAVICNYAGMPGNQGHVVAGGNVVINGPPGLTGGARREIAMANSDLVFGQRHALEVPFVLMPNEALTVRFTSIPNLIQAQPAVSIMGYREEAA